MVKDTLNSVFDNLKERTTNPFLGTLIVVWVVKNWKLVYSLLYFDGNFKLKDRLQYITDYFNERSFISNMLGVILITLGVLVSTYILLTLSRLLTDYYERVVIPWVSKVTDKSTVVLKVEYNKVLEEVKRLEGRLEEERLAKFTAQNERDSADERLAKIKLSHNTEESSIAVEEGVSEDDFSRIANKLGASLGSDTFNSIIDTVLAVRPIAKDNESIKLLLREGILKLSQGATDGFAYYSITDYGQNFIKYWNKIFESQTG